MQVPSLEEIFTQLFSIRIRSESPKRSPKWCKANEDRTDVERRRDPSRTLSRPDEATSTGSSRATFSGAFRP